MGYDTADQGPLSEPRSNLLGGSECHDGDGGESSIREEEAELDVR